MSLRLSFKTTSAALVVKSSLIPLAILPMVPILHGTTIIVLYCADPEANGALKSFLAYI
jgi:hypothetical protein